MKLFNIRLALSTLTLLTGVRMLSIKENEGEREREGRRAGVAINAIKSTINRKALSNLK